MANNNFLSCRSAALSRKRRISSRVLKLTAAILCVLLMLSCVVGLNGCADNEEYSFELCDDGYIITGYHGDGGDVVLPERHKGKPVIGIGDRAFLDCESLTSVTIPDSVTSIGFSAFDSCTSLTGIAIPDSVTQTSGIVCR